MMRRGTVLKVDVQLNLYLYLLSPITKCHFGVQSTILYYKEVLKESKGKNRLVFKKNNEHFRPITFFLGFVYLAYYYDTEIHFEI